MKTASHNVRVSLEPVTYRLPSYWASYLINGDGSGLEDSEIAQADAFLASHNLPGPVSCEEVGFCHSNDAGTLAGDCEDYTFLLRVVRYRKNSIEAKLDSLLPQFPSYDVIAHELWADGDGWSVNDSWHLARGCDREDAISHLANRWQVFKANYAPKARVRDLIDYSCDEESGSLLEVDGIPFAEVRNGGEGK